MSRADGLVDPASEAEVSVVLAAVLDLLGPDGLLDLLTRLPGTRTEPATPRRRFTAGRPASVSVGPEDVVVIGDPVEVAQVVGGVVLHRDSPRRAELPGVLAGLVVRLARAESSYDETAVVLTAAHEATQRL